MLNSEQEAARGSLRGSASRSFIGGASVPAVPAATTCDSCVCVKQQLRNTAESYLRERVRSKDGLRSFCVRTDRSSPVGIARCQINHPVVPPTPLEWIARYSDLPRELISRLELNPTTAATTAATIAATIAATFAATFAATIGVAAAAATQLAALVRGAGEHGGEVAEQRVLHAREVDARHCRDGHGKHHARHAPHLIRMRDR
jgi:hypothetical protein